MRVRVDTAKKMQNVSRLSLSRTRRARRGARFFSFLFLFFSFSFLEIKAYQMMIAWPCDVDRRREVKRTKGKTSSEGG